MRMSQLFGQTLREAPADVETANHALLLRAGYIRQIGTGVYTILPLGLRMQRRIEAIIREEMERIGGQELEMPVVHPAELWKQTRRYFEIGEELTRFTDRAQRELVLAMTHEEIVAALTQSEIRSYRQLPRTIYQIQTKWRDDPRPRGGLIRVREFTMKDSYSLDADWDGLAHQYDRHFEAYLRIFRRCGLPVTAVHSDVGMMGGKEAHEFMYLTPVGEDTILRCQGCGYTANRQVARFRKHTDGSGASTAETPSQGETSSHTPSPAPMERIATPGTTTIAGLSEMLGVEPARLAKAYFVMAKVSGPSEQQDARATGTAGAAHHDHGERDPGGHERDKGDHDAHEHGGHEPGAHDHGAHQERFVLGLIRGDLEINETKLAQAVGAAAMRVATEEEIRSVGIIPGYGGPLGIHAPATGGPAPLVVADDTVADGGALVTGANEEGFHLMNVRPGRDFTAGLVTDIAMADDGAPCPDCGAPLAAHRAVEVGNIFKLGTGYSKAVGATFLDAGGTERPVVMGSYGIGVGRLLASIAEEHRDELGLKLPVTVAPYDVHLVDLTGRSEFAESLSRDLESNAFPVLYDDRDERAGVKFNDADLIGCPLRVTVGNKGLAKGVVELKERASGETSELPADAVVEKLGEHRAVLLKAFEA